MDFEIQVSQKGGAAKLDIRGRLVLGEPTRRLREEIQNLSGRGIRRILVNLEGVSFLDSAGLGQLVASYTTVTQRGGELRLAGLSDQAVDLLELTRLSAVFGAVSASGATHPPPAAREEVPARRKIRAAASP